MKTKEKIEADLDEVIFEKRNKEYGAYFLRKGYDRNVTRALTITITLLLLTVVIPLIANYIKDDRFFRTGTNQGPEVIVIGKPNDVIDPPPPPPPPPPPINEIADRVKFRTPKVVDTTADLNPILTQGELNTRTKIDPIDDDKVLRIDQNQDDKKVIDDDANKIVEIAVVPEKPEYPGGDGEMYKFFSDNTNYPELARENKIQGIVYISFVVEPDGRLTNIKIEKGIGAGCDEEAERVVKLMPKWTAGKQNNREVRVRLVLPMRFVVLP